ncbi:unnamed protein product [Calypogeia fissa]
MQVGLVPEPRAQRVFFGLESWTVSPLKDDDDHSEILNEGGTEAPEDDPSVMMGWAGWDVAHPEACLLPVYRGLHSAHYYCTLSSFKSVFLGVFFISHVWELRAIRYTFRALLKLVQSTDLWEPILLFLAGMRSRLQL